MISTHPHNYLDRLKKSGIVTNLEAHLADLRAEGSNPEEPRAIAEFLIDRGVLSPWQHAQLERGIYKGFVLGSYLLIDRLGAGATSDVFLAEHRILRRGVAMKVLRKNIAEVEGYRERFKTEAYVAAALNHPNLVHAYDYRTEPIDYLVLEYMPGRCLDLQVRAGGPLEPHLAARYVMQAAAGLAFAHEQGYVHRDVKPGNLLASRGQLKVTDFGLAKAVKTSCSGSTLDDATLGTVEYLAPEQALRYERVDGRADVYGLGCSLYFLLTGQPPYPGRSMAAMLLSHQSGPVPNVRTLRPETPVELARICQWMMDKDVHNRPRMAAVHTTLSTWVHGQS
jgi:serine/threonine protein kinase